VLDKAGRSGAGVACSTGVDDSPIGTAFALISLDIWMRWCRFYPSGRITGPLSVASS
jgi:hypothetical protein